MPRTAQGIKVIQDQVANHTGPYHPWVQRSADAHLVPRHRGASPGQHLADLDPDRSARHARTARAHAGRLVHRHPSGSESGRPGSGALPDSEHALVGGRHRPGWHPPGHLPYVPRRFWREWMAAIKREYPNFAWSARCSTATRRWRRSFRAARRASTAWIRASIRSSIFRCFFAMRHAFAEGKARARGGHDDRPRLSLSRSPSLLVTFLGLHDVARFMNETGATAAGPRSGVHVSDDRARHSHDLLRRRDRHARRRRSGQSPRFSGRLAGGCPQRVYRRRPHAGGAGHLGSRPRWPVCAPLEPLRRGPMVNLCVSDQSYGYARTGPAGPVVVLINNAADAAQVDCDISRLQPVEGSRLVDRLKAAPDLQVTGGKVHAPFPARTAGIYVAR